MRAIFFLYIHKLINVKVSFLHQKFSMLISNAAVFDSKSVGWQKTDSEESSEHMALRERLRKTLYYGQMPSLERPSLAMTELAVDVFQEVAPRELGKIDMYWASEVSRDTMLSPYPLTVGLMYAKRLKKKNSAFSRQIFSSDLFLVSMMMASKFLHDEGEEESVLNDEWATSAHMNVEELNELERNFLTALDWNLFVDAGEFWASLSTVEKLIAYRKSEERGSFTYTDLCVLTDNTLAESLCRMLLEMCKVVAVCVVAYIAGIAVLAGVVPVIHMATLTAGSHQPLLSDQSPSTDEVPALSGYESAMEPVDREPSSVPESLTSQPLSFLVNLFQLVVFTENAVPSASFPPHQDSTIFDSASVNYTPCSHLSNRRTFCTNRNFTKARKDVCGCQQSVLKKTKTRSCHRAAPPNQHPVFSHYLLSSDKLSPASESFVDPWITSPLPDRPNASRLFTLDTLVEPA